ncbi:CidA/LrgA family protein [Brevibacillus sp. H7]|uniref:CidA/LrgA family protein n=1 Tax=Brevibacillus sp. H7 TaxID=3349138 RepID=UPI00381F16E9
MKGLLVLLAFFGLGTLGSKWLHIPLPGNLLGMLMLTVCLCAGWIKLETVERASSFLMKHMMLFFVPILVGVAQHLQLIRQDLWPILLSLVLGPILVMLISGTVVQQYVNRQKRKAENQSLERRAL